MADAEYSRPTERVPERGCGCWRDDVQVVRNLDVMTTGKHKVWTAARRLRDYLEAEEEALGLRRSGLRVLELGSGCGWLGLTVAHNLSNCRVLMTEQQSGGAVEHLMDNIAANRQLVGDRVSAAALDWSAWQQQTGEDDQATTEDEQVDVLRQHWDIILGSDLVYNEVGVSLLPRVLRALAAGGVVVLYGHTLGRFELFDIQFLENLRKEGLSVSEVQECGMATPVMPSTDFTEETLTELFPELRPVVFRIELEQTSASSSSTKEAIANP